MKPTFFPTPAAFRKWLSEYHSTTPELLVGYYKRETKKPSITWTESVDQALRYGWIAHQGWTDASGWTRGL